MVALLAMAGGGSVSAQDAAATPEPGVEQLKVGALLCQDWSCLEFGDRLDGFTIYAVDLDSGEVLDSCVTDVASEFEGCWLEVPSGARWTLDFDEAQTPEGYIYHGSIIGIEGGAYGSITYVPFHPLKDPEPGHMVVQAALCTDASCDEFEELLDDFLISAVHPVTGQEYSECMTDNAQQGLDHQCILDVPAKGQVELQWVEDQVPDGYVPFGEPIVSGEPAVTTLAFVPEDEATPVATEKPVTSLPVTGSATTATEDEGPVALIVTAMVLLGLGGGAMALDNRKRRP
jgi:hypothetical protein